MAHPKKRTTKSKKNMRRSHHSLSPVQVVKSEDGKGYKLPHHKTSVEV
jgi:large subunit ribosomal protein L32